MSNLISHKDTSIVSEAVVLAEPRPDFTATWRPYSHREVLGAVGKACDKLGWEVARKQYAIRPGSKMFAVWDLERKAGQICRTEESTLSVGIRNGIARTMSAGFCAGVRVFVCDNLAFTGDVVLFRKHTGGLEIDELDIMAEEALMALEVRFQKVVTWTDSMKKVELTAAQAMLLAGAAMARKYPLIPPSKFPEFKNLYFDMDRYSPTLHGFHGAVTELFQETAMIDLLWRNGLLVDFINFEVPVLLGQVKSASVWKPGKVPFDLVQDEAKELKAEVREIDKAEARTVVAAVKDKVQARLKEARKSPQIDDSAMFEAAKGDGKAQEGRPGKGKGKGKAKPKKASQAKPAKEIIGNIMPDPRLDKKPRRTARVKIREKIAAAAKPAKKAKVQKAPKGEVVKKARKVFAADDDVYFCEDCQGEFKRSDLKLVGNDLVCARCFEGRQEAKVIGKSKMK